MFTTKIGRTAAMGHQSSANKHSVNQTQRREKRNEIHFKRAINVDLAHDRM
jgi:hypothetical protein